MRALASLAVLLTLGNVACSANEEPRGGIAGGSGTAAGGNGASGSPAVIPNGGTPIGESGSASGGALTLGGATTSTGGSTSQAGARPSDGGSNHGGDGKAHVMTWVPPYHVQEAKQQLAASFDGMSMADGLSYLGLQFWITDGPSTRLDQVTESDIEWFHDWARQHGVKLLLCVDNNTGDWNWPEARRAFKDNKEAFATHLVNEMTARDFDGVDLDLEGIIEATVDDTESYRAFVQTLSGKLRPLGKVLTLDSFHGQWNAPNWNWWPDLLPYVDGITAMGYEQSGLDVDYQTLVDYAASAPHKLMIGVPSYKGTWLNHSVSEQLGWLVQQGKVGVAVWDASLTAPEWQRRDVWTQLKTIKTR